MEIVPRYIRIAGCIAGVSLIALLVLRGQEGPIQPRRQPTTKRQADTEPSPSLRIDTNLVQVPVTVTDRLGRPVIGLEKENFHVLDNSVEQTIIRFAMDDEAVAVGFVFDISGSIGRMLGQYQLAAHEFFKTADPADEFFLVEFESNPKLVVPLTKNAGDIQHEIMLTKSKGMTALLDAVYLAANEIRKSKLSKKALILISDGGENHSRYNVAEVKNALRETDALLYSIGPSPDDTWGDNNGRLLKQLAEITGGRLLEISRGDLADLSQKIIIDLRNRYVLYYSPQDRARDGRFHRIDVQLAPPRGLGKLTPHWRTGYYAPSE
jgi:Ca-activated chloride channel family protein